MKGSEGVTRFGIVGKGASMLLPVWGVVSNMTKFQAQPRRVQKSLFASCASSVDPRRQSPVDKANRSDFTHQARLDHEIE